MWLEKSKNQFILTNKLKTDYPCDLKHWLMHFFTIIFPFLNKDLALKRFLGEDQEKREVLHDAAPLDLMDPCYSNSY